MNHDGVVNLQGERDLNDDLFQLREFSLFVDLDITDNISASIEPAVAKNLDNFSINYAYVGFDIGGMIDAWDEEKIGRLNIRVGKFLVPFLSYNENKANFKQYLMSQPFTAWNMAPVVQSPPDFDGIGWSDTGILFNWNRETGDVGILDFKFSIIKGLQSGNGTLDSNSSTLDTFVTPPMGTPFQPTVRPRDGLIQNEPSSTFDDNNDEPAVTLKLSYRPSAIPLDFGVSWYHGAWDDDGDNNLDMYGFHANYVTKRWTLRGEYVHADVEQTAVPGTNPLEILNAPTGDYNMDAWYIEGSVVPLYYGENDSRYLRFIARFDDLDTNDKAPFTPWDRNRFTLGTEWQFISNARLRYEWQYHTLDDFSNAPAPFVAAGGEEHINMHMVSAIFWF